MSYFELHLFRGFFYAAENAIYILCRWSDTQGKLIPIVHLMEQHTQMVAVLLGGQVMLPMMAYQNCKNLCYGKWNRNGVQQFIQFNNSIRYSYYVQYKDQKLCFLKDGDNPEEKSKSSGWNAQCVTFNGYQLESQVIKHQAIKNHGVIEIEDDDKQPPQNPVDLDPEPPSPAPNSISKSSNEKVVPAIPSKTENSHETGDNNVAVPQVKANLPELSSRTQSGKPESGKPESVKSESVKSESVKSGNLSKKEKEKEKEKRERKRKRKRKRKRERKRKRKRKRRTRRKRERT